MKNISEIKQKRIKLGLTQLEISFRTGMNQSGYSKIENGKIKPSPHQLQRILESLKKKA